MSIELCGNWKKGVAYDVHTLSSNYLGTDEQGYDRWDSVRSEMGELVYQLKYHNDLSKVPVIVELLVNKIALYPQILRRRQFYFLSWISVI